MTELGVYDSWIQFTGRYCDSERISVQNSTLTSVLRNCADMDKELRVSYFKSLSKEKYLVMWWEALRGPTCSIAQSLDRVITGSLQHLRQRSWFHRLLARCLALYFAQSALHKSRCVNSLAQSTLRKVVFSKQ